MQLKTGKSQECWKHCNKWTCGHNSCHECKCNKRIRSVAKGDSQFMHNSPQYQVWLQDIFILSTAMQFQCKFHYNEHTNSKLSAHISHTAQARQLESRESSCNIIQGPVLSKIQNNLTDMLVKQLFTFLKGEIPIFNGDISTSDAFILLNTSLKRKLITDRLHFLI